MGAEFRILGPLEVWADGVRLAPGGAKQQKVLAALLLSAGQVVPVDRLVDAVWEAQPPATAAKQVRNAISDLRKLLAATGVAIEPVGAGYRFDLAGQELDAVLFAERVATARRYSAANQMTEAAAEFRTALALWHGDVLAGLDCPALRPQMTGLSENRLSAFEECVDLELDHAGPALTAELAEWLGANPLRERLAGQLMLALYRSGRQADALTVYERVRTGLADTLGIDPEPRLQALYTNILTRDAALTPRAAPLPAAARCDLPHEASHFTGRAEELRHLVDAMAAQEQNTVVISAIDGMAGVGKTTLAVHAARHLAARYPDAQLFLDLHGHTPGQPRLSPASALDKLLRALDVPASGIPADQEERAALWRARLSGRRMLVVLDNAASTSQVRPLLPGGPGCLVLVTSRHRLTSLDGASVLSLGVLPCEDAVALFGRVLGEDRVTDEPEAVEDVVRDCGYLPLAIRIAAARLRHRPTWAVAHLAERLRDERNRLAELSLEDQSVAAAFTLSYQQLEPAHQRLFMLLGLVPGPDFDTAAASALADLPGAGQILEELLDTHLIQQPSAGRYRLHDLLRAYAADLATTELDDNARDTAMTRLIEYYLAAANAASQAISPRAGVRQPDLPDYEHAMAWLDSERLNLLAAAKHAADGGKPSHHTKLAAALRRFLHIRGHHQDALALHTAALAMARSRGNRVGESHSLLAIGDAHRQLGRYDDALQHYQQGLELAREAGHRVLESHALGAIGDAHRQLGAYRQAVLHYGQALDLARTSRDRDLEGYALCGLGTAHRRLREYDEALTYLDQALGLARVLGTRDLEGYVWCALGAVHRDQGRLDEAETELRRALSLGGHDLRGRVQHALGDTHRHAGRWAEAAVNLEDALAIAHRIADRDLETEVLTSMGELARRTKDPARAVYFQRALAVAAETGNKYLQARAHEGLAQTHQDLRDTELALDHRRRAQTLYTEINAPEAALA